MDLRSLVKTQLSFAVTVCIATLLLTCSVAQAKSTKDKFGLTEEQMEVLHSRANRNDWQASEALKAAKQFAAEEKFNEADKAFKQAEELMLAYKGDQFFLKIVYEAQLAHLVKHKRTAEAEDVFAKLQAAKLRIPRSKAYESNAMGPRFFLPPRSKDAPLVPTIPEGPPIPDDQ